MMRITRSSLTRIFCICPAIFFLFSGVAHAGLSLQIDILSEGNGFFTCNPILSTNANLPDSTPATYDQVYSPHTNLVGGLGNGHTENRPPFLFSDLAQEITNGQWSLVLNVGATNEHTYHFTITATNFTSGFFVPVGVVYPPDGTTNVSQTPVFQWSGPANWDALTLFVFNNDFSFTSLFNPPPNSTSFALAQPLTPGNYFVQVNYTLLNTPATFTASTPKDTNNNSLSGWVPQPARYDAGAQNGFTVVAPPPLIFANTDPSLVAYYSFNDPDNPGTDNSGNGNDLNYTTGWNGGSVAYDTNAVAGGGALFFNNNGQGGGGVLSGNPTPTNLLKALAGSFTVAVWVNTSDYFDFDGDFAYNGEGIVAADLPGQHNDVIPMALVGGDIGFNTGISGSGDDTLNSQQDIDDGNYHLIAVTRDQSTGLKLIYIDGALDSDPNNPDFGTTNLLNDPELLTIGSLADASQPSPLPQAANYYNGYGGWLDELQIYSRVLSSNEISFLFQNPGTPILNGAGGVTNVVHYTFDNTNDIYHDDSGNGNDVTSVSTFGFGYPVSDLQGVSGAALDFNGSNFLTLPTNLLSTLAGDFSVSTWVKTTQVSGSDSDQGFQDADILWADAPGVANDSIPLALTGHKLGLFTGNPDTTLHSTNNIDTGSFVFLTVTRQRASATRKVYINGVLDSSDTGVGGTNFLTDSTQLIMALNYGSFLGFIGSIDDFQMYQGVLSDAQVGYLYSHAGQTVSNGTVIGLTLTAPAIVGGNFQFSFLSTPGHTDAVYAATNLVNPVWVNVTNIPGDGTLKTFMTPANTPAQQYFRISVQ
jgi:Concanavalin A-like lectin/glucanases superfamily